MNLADLPQDILLHVYSFLEADDVRCLSLVSRKLKDSTYFEGIWRRFCFKDYKVELGNQDKEISARNLYMKMLRPYGFIVGLWQPTVKHYGGLVDIQFERGQLVAVELYAPFYLDWKYPLKRKKLFTVSLDSDGERVKIMNPSGKEAKIRFLKRNDTDAFNFCLLKAEKTIQTLRDQEEGFKKWLKEQGYEAPSTSGYHSEMDTPGELTNRFLISSNYKNSCTFRRIKGLPKKKPGYPIQPGYFKAYYGDHGPELIMLTYANKEPKATALKLTGDRNVPAGKVTFFANLNHSLNNVTWNDQRACYILNTVKAENIPYSHEDYLNTPPQVFRLPDYTYEGPKEPAPEISIGRFQGFCQTANRGYKNPSFSKGHWVIFDQDTFAFLFLEINTVIMYYRVKEPRLFKYF